MKNSQLKQDFIKEFACHTEIEREDVETFLESRVEVDTVTLKRKFVTRLAQNYISSLKGPDGLRTYIACKHLGKRLYANVDATDDVVILRSQLSNLKEKAKGIQKNVSKIEAKIFEIEHQVHFTTTTKLGKDPTLIIRDIEKNEHNIFDYLAEIQQEKEKPTGTETP